MLEQMFSSYSLACAKFEEWLSSRDPLATSHGSLVATGSVQRDGALGSAHIFCGDPVLFCPGQFAFAAHGAAHDGGIPHTSMVKSADSGMRALSCKASSYCHLNCGIS